MRRFIRTLWEITIPCLVLASTSPVFAQQYAPSPAVSLNDVRAQTLQQSRMTGDSEVVRVSLSVKDGTIEYAVNEVTRQAGIRPLYYSDDSLLKRRITVRLDKVAIMDALAAILKGTGLTAKMATDRKVVMIRGKGREGSEGLTKQGTPMSGRVVDSATQQAVSGATVSVMNTNSVVVTNQRGVFTLSLPSGQHQIQVRLIGYRTAIVPVVVTGDKPVNVTISLVPTATSLSQVVTTATGKQRRLEVPSDIVRIDPAKIMERAPVRSFTDLLEAAQVPGVLVTRGNGEPGAPSKIRIRGLKSITQSNDPVVIVDGNFIDASVGSPSGFDDIDPSIIESVEIIRGPSASTLYGQDAANGVIVITTKKGHAGPARWNTSYQRSWGQPYGTIPLRYLGYGHFLSNGLSTQCNIRQVIDKQCAQDSVMIFDPNHPLVRGEGSQTVHRFVAGVDGGTSAMTYAMTATTDRTIGARRLVPIDMIRLRMRNIAVSSKFRTPAEQRVNTITMAVTMIPSQNMTLGVTVTGSQTDLVDNNTSTFYGVFPAQQSLDTVVAVDKSTIGFAENPTQRSNLLFGGRIDWRVLNGGVITANAGISRNVTATSNFQRNVNCRVLICADTTGQRIEQNAGTTELTARLNGSKPLNLGALSRVLDLLPSFGADFRRTNQALLIANMQDIPAGERALAGGRMGAMNSTQSSSAVAGWYVNTRIGIFQRLYFDVGVRQDIGSAIRSTTGNGTTYPKLGGSWVVSEEPFWPKTSWVQTFRIRTALGYSAIQPEVADVHGRYRMSSAFLGNTFVPAIYLDAPGNPVLKPERAMEVEMGFDADLFGDRINLVATYAQSENLNAMINRQQPPSVGVTRERKENIGQVRNRNIELTSTIRAIDSKLARVELSHTMTMRDNVVVRLGNGVTPFSSTAVGRVAEGFPLGAVWVNHLLGYRDQNGDGLLAAEEVVQGDSSVYAGWSQPRYETGYGINVTVLSRLTFDARLSYRSQYVQQLEQSSGYGTEDVHAPLAAQADALLKSINNRRAISDLRWNSASVTYHLPVTVIQALNLRTLSVSLQGSNLGLWTNYVGRDPGMNSGILASEVAWQTGKELPPPRQFVLRVTIGL